MGSLALDGTGYAEAADNPDLNLTGDWTIEAWFKDEDPNGFNHDFRQLVAKGDDGATAESPYFLLVGQNEVLGGVRTGGVNYAITYSLVAAGASPNTWHHVALNFLADQNLLNLLIDGRRVRSQYVPAHSAVGNTLPVEIGRSGAISGKYWRGKIDDVRIWNVFRLGADIAASYREEFATPPPGLVANWRFDEDGGPVASDSTHTHSASLNGGASFSPDVHVP